MHRQSLGSPVSKLPIEENATSPPADEENDKSLKPHKPSLKPEWFIHVIPLFILLCFLVLYLSSHHPSQTDTNEMDGLKRYLEVGGRSEILGIRSLKNHQERQYRPHRKIADF